MSLRSYETRLNQRTYEAVIAAVRTGADTPRAICKQLNGPALITIRHALRQLCDLGRLRFDGADSHRRYRVPE